MTCLHCTAPAGRIRTVTEGDGWRHHYACLRVGDHRFSTVETIADKPRTDRKQVRRMLDQIGQQLARLGEVVG